MSNRNVHRLYLCAPVNALVEGIYEERIPYSQVKKHGDFGLGTFDGLDGEMIMLDGHIYQMKADGTVAEVGDDTLTPFACVTHYVTRPQRALTQEMDYEAFLAWLQALMPSPNIFYAFRIDGEFAYMKVRSVPKSQSYIPLVEIAKNEPIFEFTDIRGTLAGFYTPDFMSSINVPGMHLHFISDSREHGGHLLGCRPRDVAVGVQMLQHLELSLPLTSDYMHLDFHRDISRDLDQVEK